MKNRDLEVGVMKRMKVKTRFTRIIIKLRSGYCIGETARADARDY